MAKHGLLQVYNSDVDVQVFHRKLWSLSMVPREDIVQTFLEIQKDIPVWDEDEDEGCAAEALNNRNEELSSLLREKLGKFNIFIILFFFFNVFII